MLGAVTYALVHSTFNGWVALVYILVLLWLWVHTIMRHKIWKNSDVSQ